MVEYLPSKQGVAGSSPVSRSSLNFTGLSVPPLAHSNLASTKSEFWDTRILAYSPARSDHLPMHIG